MSVRRVILQISVLVLVVNGQRFRPDRHDLPLDDLQQATGFSASNRISESYRLPNTSLPTQYNLYLDTNIHQNDFQYSGNVQIQLTTLEDTKQLVLHSTRHQITKVQLFNANQLEVALSGYDTDKEKEFVIINTKSTLPANTNYLLLIEFTGELQNVVTGFYRSSYKADDGSTRYVAITQFQASYARSAFPCYDEPSIRASFSISISCGTDYRATSNMPIAEISIQPNQKKLTRFHTTPGMPTYLVAFMVTDFVSKRTILKEPTLLTMETFARASAVGDLGVAIEKGPIAIRTIEQYFNQTYSLPKLDQVAVPNFMFLAMENWGLVKYAESGLFVNEQTSTNRQKSVVVSTIVHEFVHQFFGNLVTPTWWTDLFLNEGFATFYEYYIGSSVEPSIRFKELLPVESLQLALVVDSSASSRPLSYYKDSDLMSLFDTITYDKAGSVLRMMNYALGERTFQRGLRRYLAQNKGTSVDPNDLFESLQSAAKEDAVIPLSTTVGSIMSPWIYQSGYPLVTVSRVPNSDEIVFKQEHFSESADTGRTWWIPISYRLSSASVRDETNTVFWMPQGASQVLHKLTIPNNAYLLVNPHQTGFYRVNYDTDLWRRLIQQLTVDHEILPAVSRAQLIDDSMKLVSAKKLDVTLGFALLQYLANEVDYIPWYSAFASENLQHTNKALVVNGPAYEAFQTFLRVQLDKVFLMVGFEGRAGEPHEHQQLRALAIEWSCRMGSATCRAGARQLLAEDLTGSKKVPSYLKRSVYCGGLMDASEAEFVAVFRAYQNTDDLSERSLYISALGCNENSKFLSDYLMITLGGGQEISLKTGEWLQILNSVYSKTSKGFEAFSNWLEANNNSVMSTLGARREFQAILSDITIRKSNLVNFEQLIGLLKRFQSQT